MKLLVTGACGFVGSTLSSVLREELPGVELIGVDNLARDGSESNRSRLRALGVKLVHGDMRLPSDLAALPAVDWVIDAAANPSVLAGVSELQSSRQLVEHNLIGTVNVLEFCKEHRAGLILLSTSRVYSLRELQKVKLETRDGAFQLAPDCEQPHGVSEHGLSELFSTEPPLSLYGATKAASETLALEYGQDFGFPVWINRCGVLAGAGQFGRADQGIFAYWINSYLRGRPLKYIGFGGSGQQVRDCLHPADLAPLVIRQMAEPNRDCERVCNVGGGNPQSLSLAKLNDWCVQRFGPREILRDDRVRQFDVPWLVLDAGRAERLWDWRPRTPLLSILEEIARHAEKHPHWLELSGAS